MTECNLSCGHGSVRLAGNGVGVVHGVARLGGGVGAYEGAGLAHRDGDQPRVRVGVVPALRLGNRAPRVSAL